MRRQTKLFDRFKSYLNKTIESFSSGLISWTATKTQKLGRVAKAEKLKFAGNKDQFLFNSELSGTLDEARSFLAAKNIGGVKGKLADLDKSLKRRQKITKRADKSEAGWVAVKEYQAEELAGDSEDEKRIRKAQERALKKKKQNAPKRSEKGRVVWASRWCFSYAAFDERQFFRGISLPFLCISAC